MALAAFTLFTAFMLLTGVRTLVQRGPTGDWGSRRTLLPRGSVEWWGLAAVDLGLLLVGLGAPLADWAGMPLLAVADHPVVHGLGFVLAVLGILAAFTTQLALGASWRIGVDEAERTALMTTGPFRLVRNPVFTAVAVAFLGMALMVPNPVAIAGLAVTLIGIEIQVRLVEEPYLRRIHGAEYMDYAARVGRFLPGIGRHRRPGT
ncbi:MULTISPECIES: isoprenylcysteine carboxylmethyltransferase family protein [unclassified Paenarthrobacter]|uniref:methyltransferase family protein n=1 Tax=unclassified Paenarthrobacter TaxID=2634190 RepID=UPI00084E5DDD|nr:isoprenylcysteine carboxylmethyltransferase family protein [Paenarthrobacter sp. R1]NKR10621.1 isoprenylcysteine carboxyl methyltransferase [Arthrobacter sp. M5]NKR16462.1 isoprenylcysteine carboxyl methyltransferase [Arthrobacter sp. M6]OEH61428.1 isoprenylcysteine carboxyl methyltransferase [Arthrobacter sp. D4]OEH64414.1 isoprenylcysteine carboxyl methyltransferase [Arthrobacter sp. D2]WIV33304.1 isoprenylcysteine carboxylmethyltransferase family protein [Paenarthrobacter sp. R1]